MKLRVETQIDIDAPAALVWSILIDFDRHSEWNPFVRSIQGVPLPGERLQVCVRAEGARGMSFRPTVVRFDEPRELRWMGRLLIPGLFDGEHYFRLEPLGDRRTYFIHGELFSGALVGLARNVLAGATRQGFEEMNRALKRRAESLLVGVPPPSRPSTPSGHSEQQLFG